VTKILAADAAARAEDAENFDEESSSSKQALEAAMAVLEQSDLSDDAKVTLVRRRESLSHWPR
jgi:hypothetical protein